jgi:hypothetical protein
MKKNSVALFLFLFTNIREEGIWLLPSLILMSFIMLISVSNKYKLLLKSFVFSILVLVGLTFVASLVNYSKYNSFTSNIFKNSDFQAGYGALQRVKRDKLLLESINNSDFQMLYLVSPSLLRLKTYIDSEAFKGWVGTACYAHESQWRNILKDSSCPTNMPVGFMLFAIMDGMWSIGLRSPEQMKEFMKKVIS